MKRHKLCLVASLALLSAVVAACAAQPPTPVPLTAQPGASRNEPEPAADLARADEQGAVDFVVTPLNLSAAGATLDFDVSMNTHSVDLGWDLAAQSVLKTDTGLEVAGQSWPLGSGHHYAGTLSFPAAAAGGVPLLAGASALTLIIQGTDVPERVFTWELGQ